MTRTEKKHVDKRISDLTAEKDLTLKEYAKAARGDQRDILAERNMRISMELKFLNTLIKL